MVRVCHNERRFGATWLLQDTAMMATDSAPVPTCRRNYWQLPLLAAGITAAVMARTAFPPPPPSPADRIARDITALRQVMERRPIDHHHLERLTISVADLADKVPESSSLAHYLVGSGYLMLGEMEPTETELWVEATHHLQQVDQAKLADPSDQKKLAFRKAKAQAGSGQGDANTLTSILSKPPVGEDIEGERRRILAETYLRATPPDMKRARDELGTYLSGQTKLPAPMVARYRLKLGEMHFTLDETDKARTWLKDIGPTAPAEVQASAKLLLGRLAQAEGNWPEAVKLYEAAQSMQGLPAEQMAQVRYLTGVGQMKLRNPTAAIPYFEQAAKDPGTVGVAAAIRLAEISARTPSMGKRTATVDLLDQATRGIVPGSEFRNPYLTVTEVQAAFEEVIQVAVNEGDFASAVRAANGYGKVAVSGRDREKRAEVNTLWATSLRQAKKETEAQARSRDAAEDFLRLAAVHPTPGGRVDLFRRAAAAYRQAGDDKAASLAIDQITQVPGLPEEASAAAWLDKGELLLAAGQFVEGTNALQKAMNAPGPTAASARVKLALAHLDQARAKARTGTPAAQAEAKGLQDFGQQLLTQVANATPSPAERESHQQALFELGKLQLFQQNLADAESRFRQLVMTYPGSPMTGQAKLYLGSCLLLVARGDGQGGRPPIAANDKLTEALTLFQDLSASGDPFLRTQADLRIANTTLLLKKYDEMPDLCEKLAKRYQGQVEELIILSMLYSGYRAADRPEPAARTLIRMEKAYAALKPTDFNGSAEEYTPEYWQKQWFEPLKGK